MKKTSLKLTLLVFLVAAAFVGCLKDNELVNDAVTTIDQQNLIQPTTDDADINIFTSQPIPGQYIVVYKDDALTTGRSMESKSYAERQSIMKEETKATLQKNNIKAEKMTFVYGSTIKGFALKDATEQEIEELRRDDQIAYIEQDQTVSISMGGPPGGGGNPPPQVTPWGITRVNGGVSGASGRAFIIDTGIDMDHSDLNVDQNDWFSAWTSGPNAGPEDKHGHGTHVSGTVAAIDDAYGVVGVAAGATVVAVKVLDRRGSGSNSGVIAGVNWVAAPNGGNANSNDAANMSLGGGVSTALDNAVIAASSSCKFALAAGNESDHANNHSPARANGSNIYTIASMTSTNDWSSFSNYGQPPVDYIAPGSSVFSTYKDGGYATMSGTSMASPHVCGILLLGNIVNGGTVSHSTGNYTIANH